jgi:predicted dehydrogenase
LKQNILIIGKGSISFKHLKILSQIYQKAIITHISSRVFLRKHKKILNKKYFIVVVANDAASHLKTIDLIDNFADFIFVEKPFAENFSKLKNFLNKHKSIQKKIWVGYNLIFSELLREIIKIIKSKKYGKVISVRSTVGYDVRYWRKKNYLSSVSVKKKLGGGVINELSHEINYLVHIFRELNYINSISGNYYLKKIDVEDTLFVNFLCNKNILINLTMDFYRQDKMREAQFIFQKGTIFLDFVMGKILFKNKDSSKLIMKNKKDLDLSYKKQWLFLKKNFNQKFNNELNIVNSLETLKLIKKIKQN